MSNVVQQVKDVVGINEMLPASVFVENALCKWFSEGEPLGDEHIRKEDIDSLTSRVVVFRSSLGLIHARVLSLPEALCTIPGIWEQSRLSVMLLQYCALFGDEFISYGSLPVNFDQMGTLITGVNIRLPFLALSSPYITDVPYIRFLSGNMEIHMPASLFEPI